MTLIPALLFIAFCVAAFAFADLLRVALGSNARFVMLRGALFGLAISMFSGSSYLAGKPYIMAGVCALAAYPGGAFSFSSQIRGKYSSGFRRYIPSLTEGGLSGGIFCGMISFYLSTAAGKFNVMQILMLFILAPVFALSSYVFDRFYNTDKSNVNNREIIIPLIGILASIIIFGCFSGDTLMISAAFVGSALFAAASVGAFVLNSFLLSFRSDFFHSRDLHEALYGALTGAGASLTFIICRTPLASRLAVTDSDGFAQIGLHPVAGIVATLVLVLFALDQVQYFILPKWSQNQILSKILSLLKQYEFFLYCLLPFTVSCMGSSLLPEIIATVIISVFAWQLLCKRVFQKNPDQYIYIIIIFIPILGMLFVRLSTDWVLSSEYLILIYTVLYEASSLYLDYAKRGTQYLKGAGLPRHVACILLSALLIAGTKILPKVI